MIYNWKNIEEIVSENKRRLEKNNIHYDPIVGTEVSDVIKRNRLELPDAVLPLQFIPDEMESEPIIRALRKGGTIKQTARGMFGGAVSENDMLRVWKCFVRCRLKYDFEFWCASQWRIIDKETAMLVPFILNRPQRTILLPEMEKKRKAHKPIDIILLKARQWGGSTMTDAYQSWIQMEWKKNWNSVICADVDDQAKVVLGMMETAIDNYDTSEIDEEKPDLKPYMRTDSTRQITTRGCTISVGSAQHPEKIRSQNLKMAHLTEVGLWTATPKRKPEDLVQAIFGSINPGEYTMKVLESTAKGVGNYFHRTYQAAKKGKNNFTPVFVAWWQIDLYQTSIPNYKNFIESMSQNEKWLFTLGATLESIAWYRIKDTEFEGEHWRMCSEFPSTDTEAFQSTGGVFFPNEYVDPQYENCTDPVFVGEIYGREEMGVNALEDITLSPEAKGNFKIWKYADHQTKMRNRYIVTVDVCVGSSPSADYSIIYVMDRYWQHEADGIPETAAEWHGHIDVDKLAWKAAQVAKYYNDALLVIEKNSIDTNRVRAYRTILNEIKPFVRNLYKKVDANKGDDNIDRENYGWSTNGQSKPAICDKLKECLRDHLYIERCREAVDELKTFERKDDGHTLGAVDGCHDDRVITRAIALYFIYQPLMGRVEFVEEKEEKPINVEAINEFTMI